MNKNLLSIIIFLITIINSANAQFEFFTLPTEMTKGANAIVREERQEFAVQSLGKAVERYHLAITILNEAGNKYAQVGQGYSKLTRLRSMEATLYNLVGKPVRKLKMTDFTDQSMSGGGYTFFDDNRVKMVDLSYTEYPYTVVFDYELVHDGLLFYPVWVPQAGGDVAVVASVFEMTLPAGMDLRYKAVNFPAEPLIKKAEQKTYYWEAKNLPPFQTESYVPVGLQQKARVYTAPTDFEIEGYTGDMRTWESFGLFIAKLNAGTEKLPEASINRFKNLVANCKNDLCKIQTLYHYLQSNTRYVNISLGIGGWRPMPAADVDAYKYGDCKALSNYFCAMLDAVGIKGYYTLIRSDDNYDYLMRDFPSSQFNHAVVCVPQGKDTLWVECTSQTESLGYFGRSTCNRAALLITPQGGKLVRTPNFTAVHNLQHRVVDLTIDPEGNAEASIHTRYTGLQQDYRSYLAEMPERQRRDLMYEQLGLKNFEILQHTFDRQKDRLPAVDEQLRLKLPAYIGKSGKRLFVQPNVLSTWTHVPTADSTRQQAVQFSPFPFVDVDTVKMVLPMDYTVERLPEPVQIQSAFGAYEARCSQEGNAVLYIRKLSLNAEVQPREKFVELVDFCKKMSKADARKMVLVKP
jgi:hypothetical protein